MKYLLILLLLFSCGSRQKTKTTDKAKVETEVKAKTKIETEVETELNAEIETKVETKTEVKTEITALQSIQNLNLKNSGKCQDAGQVRFLSFTDKNGSKLEVPVAQTTRLVTDWLQLCYRP